MNPLTKSQIKQLLTAHKAAAKATQMDGVVLVCGWSIQLKAPEFRQFCAENSLPIYVERALGCRHLTAKYQGVSFTALEPLHN